MNKTEEKVFDKIIDELERNLEYKFVNIQITDRDTSEIEVEVGFDYNFQFADGDVAIIRHSYFVADGDWDNVGEITNVNDFKKYINEKQLVERWNEEILDNEAYYLKESVSDFIKDFLNDGYVVNKVEELSGEVDEGVDVDEIVSALEDLKVIVKYDNADFWTEEVLIEYWEYEVEEI